MARCTWKGCTSEGTESQKDNNGEEWALLCSSHHGELDQAIDLGLAGDSKGAPRLLRAWILASGGNPLSRALDGEEE